MVLTPRRWCQVRGKQNFSRMTVARKPGHRGERGVSRNPSRRESRIASAEPVCSCAFCPITIAHETAGAARTRLSLRPLALRGRPADARLGRIAPRDRGRTSSRCLTIESEIHSHVTDNQKKLACPIPPQRSKSTLVLGVEQQIKASPSPGGSIGSGEYLSSPSTIPHSQL